MIYFFLDVCTGKLAEDHIIDATNPNAYYVCGKCPPERVVCPTGQKYDAQCKKCVTNAFPNCDLAGKFFCSRVRSITKM